MGYKMTNLAVDLTNLRELTDGDRDMEVVLFEEFFVSTEQLINQLGQALESNKSDEWKAAAHALKGTSYNLGAQKLGDYCKIAQDKSDLTPQEKQQLLSSITQEYADVKTYLEKILE